MTRKPLGITDVVLRDAHQSLFATRLRLEDMLPIAPKLDNVGFWSLESWGGATFDACIRFLGEDPWERIRELKKAMPKTPQQMLLRGQNLLGYRHYADDVVDRFVERAAKNGVDVFRIFDAMNDPRNLQQAVKAVLCQGKHAQGTLSYTSSPIHTMQAWFDLAKRIEDMGAHSICIKDMAGLLRPYEAFELISQLKKALAIPVHMQCHATTGMSTASILKAVEAGVDNVDTAISSMSMTYGHSPTEAVVAILQGTDRDTGLDLLLLEEIAAYFREVRKKYAKFEGSLKGIDSRILIAQVPGGMLTNMESQLKEQNASEKIDAVLAEIPKVREELGFIPLVTPTSQIVGTQAVLNVLSGERYKVISKEARGILRGEYGAAPAPFNAELQLKALEGDQPITCRPADLLSPEMASLETTLERLSNEKNFKLESGERRIDDVLTYALFSQVGLKFLENRGNASAFEPRPSLKSPTPITASGEEIYTITLEGESYTVTVTPGGDISGIVNLQSTENFQAESVQCKPAKGDGEPFRSPLAGSIVQVLVQSGQQVKEGQTVLTLEAMKMETEISAAKSGIVSAVLVKSGDSVKQGDPLLIIT